MIFLSELLRTEAHAILRNKDYEPGTFIIRKGSHAMGKTNKGTFFYFVKSFLSAY